MIHYDKNNVMVIKGKQIEILSELGAIVSRIVGDFECDPNTIAKILKFAIEQGIKNRKEKNPGESIAFDASPLEDFEDSDDTFRKMFGDMFNE